MGMVANGTERFPELNVLTLDVLSPLLVPPPHVSPSRLPPRAAAHRAQDRGPRKASR